MCVLNLIRADRLLHAFRIGFDENEWEMMMMTTICAIGIHRCNLFVFIYTVHDWVAQSRIMPTHKILSLSHLNAISIAYEQIQNKLHFYSFLIAFSTHKTLSNNFGVLSKHFGVYVHVTFCFSLLKASKCDGLSMLLVWLHSHIRYVFELHSHKDWKKKKATSTITNSCLNCELN